ncbi:hypothetical protein Tco_0684691 [Tanacetum coccineum]
MPTLRTAEVDLTKNDEALEIKLDIIEEKREQAAIQDAKSKAKMEKYYNSKVRSTSFGPGDMVTVAMMRATPRMEENLALNRKDHTNPQQKEGKRKYWLHPPKSGKTEARKLSPSLVGEEPRHASWLPQHEHGYSSRQRIGRSPDAVFNHKS